MSSPTEQQSLERRCEAIDRLLSIDFPRRGVIRLLYEAARQQAGQALCLRAANVLKSGLSAGRVALIATGWLDRPHVSLNIAETDGPPGAAVLARALHVGLGAIPFVLVEREIMQSMIAVMHAAGLRCVAPEETLAARSGSGALHAASVIALPSDRSKAESLARDLLEKYDIGAFAAVEKGGENGRGRICTSRGADTTDALGKADAILEACMAKGIPTVGIGDGGNEIGMGLIRECLAGKLRNSCGPDGSIDGGIMPANRTDALVAATVSNWGAYGIAAALAMILKRPQVLHTVEMERRIMEASVAAGFIDGVSGYVSPSADGLPLEVQLNMVRLLRTFVGDGVNTTAWRRYPDKHENGAVART